MACFVTAIASTHTPELSSALPWVHLSLYRFGWFDIIRKSLLLYPVDGNICHIFRSYMAASELSCVEMLSGSVIMLAQR